MIVFLTMVGAVVFGLIVAVIYLNDRVNHLERRSAAGAGSGSGGGAGGDDNTWHGLSGKRLWDAMTGKKGITSLDEAALADLRQAYELVLAKHIEGLFVSGQTDARRQQNNQPSSVKTVSSPRGQVQSWIPLNHANAIYRAGADSIKPDIFEVERARMALDEAAQILYAQAGIPSAQLFSELLMPLEASPVAAPSAAQAGGSSPAGPSTSAAPPALAGGTGEHTGPAAQGPDTGARRPAAALEAPAAGAGLSGGLFGNLSGAQPVDRSSSGS